MLTILLAIIIILLVLIIVMVVLLSGHSHHVRAETFTLLLGYSLNVRKKLHGRNPTFGLTSITTFAAAGLWKRSAGISATARLS